MERLLGEWSSTEYMSGQQCRGEKADCIGFVFGYIDELYGRPTPARGVLPQDTCMHSKNTAIAGMKTLLRLYSPTSSVEDGTIQPGDVIVVGPSGGGPGHVMVVGPRRNQIWHCTNGVGVIQGGLGFADGQSVFGIYRFGDREKWLR